MALDPLQRPAALLPTEDNMIIYGQPADCSQSVLSGCKMKKFVLLQTFALEWYKLIELGKLQQALRMVIPH